MKRLTKNQVLLLHHELIAESGGSNGIRDEGLLDSALNAPFQTFDNEPVFPSLQYKAARLGYGLIKNHSFIDGNKRIGTHAMIIFLAINGIELQYGQKELYEIILKVASNEATLEDLTQWILEHQA